MIGRVDDLRARTARGSASSSSTVPTATMRSPSMSTEPGSRIVDSRAGHRQDDAVADERGHGTSAHKLSTELCHTTVTSTVRSRMARRHPVAARSAPVAEALGAELVGPKHVRAGDIPLEWEGEVVGGLRLPGVQGALERMVAAVEAELGDPLKRAVAEDKQRAVRLLDERGAFQLRKAVEDVADAMGVSRFTVYNYLNAAG